MIVEAGDRLIWKATGCLVEVVEVVDTYRDWCAAILIHVDDECEPRSIHESPIGEYGPLATQDRWFDWAETEFQRFVRKTLREAGG